jgi:hypothetical protein
MLIGPRGGCGEMRGRIPHANDRLEARERLEVGDDDEEEDAASA